MKKILVTIFFSVLLGCSSTYRLTDFPSKENFYEDFNNYAKDKNIKATLTNDSIYNSLDGANISNDTLIITTQIQTEEKKIKLKEIESIKYTSGSYSEPSARIILKSGTEFNGEDIIVLSDSTLEFKIKKFTYKRVSLNRVREISFKKRWLGIPVGFLAGSAFGFYVGFVASSVADKKTQSSYNVSGYYFILGSPIGAIVGSLVGWLIGYNYIYQFNP